MSYEKHTWETGETITAEKLNNIEDGIASASGGDNSFFIVGNIVDNNIVLNETWINIYNAFCSGKNCVVIIEDSSIVIATSIQSVFENNTNNTYIVIITDGSGETISLYTNTPNGYPGEPISVGEPVDDPGNDSGK